MISMLRVLSGIALIITGVLLCIFGGLFYLVYGIWDIIQTWHSMTFGLLLWDIFLLVIRDVIAIGFGIALCFIGFVLADFKKS